MKGGGKPEGSNRPGKLTVDVTARRGWAMGARITHRVCRNDGGADVAPPSFPVPSGR